MGRYANRIKNGTFSINGVTSHIPENEHGGLDTLHGGTVGYDQRNFTVVSHNTSTITFSFLDQGLEGFPGSVVRPTRVCCVKSLLTTTVHLRDLHCVCGVYRASLVFSACVNGP